MLLVVYIRCAALYSRERKKEGKKKKEKKKDDVYKPQREAFDKSARSSIIQRHGAPATRTTTQKIHPVKPDFQFPSDLFFFSFYFPSSTMYVFGYGPGWTRSGPKNAEEIGARLFVED